MNILPPVKLDHLKALTDDAGIIQHSKYSVPNRSEGYTTDDNARALVACVKLLQIHDDKEVRKLANTYLSFLFHMQRPEGKFHNLMSYDRRFLDDVGSEDCMGRALWACGHATSTHLPEGIRTTAKEIFDRGFPNASSFESPRAKAFTILGLYSYYEAYPNDQNLAKNIVLLTDKLIACYRLQSSSEWCWFEPYLTYANSRLPQALFSAHRVVKHKKYVQIAKKSFDFLIETQTIGEKFVPIGNKGWYKKGNKRALYDQQPIEASCMVEASLTALQVTHEEKYRILAYLAFEWFLGKNTRDTIVYDAVTGACHDGITSEGLNLNQGAEATISYLLARLELENLG